LSSVESKTSPCEACSGDEESGSEVQNVASVYCVECQLKLCQNCERVHRKSKLTRSRKPVKIGDNMNVQSMPPSYCDQHGDKKLESHNGHICSDVNEVEDEFRKHMTNDFGNISAGVAKFEEMLQNLDKEKDGFIEQVRKMGTEISEKARTASDVHDRADELLNFSAIERTLAGLGHADVTFTSSEYDVNKACGQLHLNAVTDGELF